METTKYFFNDIVVGEEGLLKGPFGSDLKKELYVPKGKTTYKVYLQENILKQNNAVGEHYISKDYYEKSMKRYAVKEGDFIVTCDGTLGEIFQLKNITEPGIISSSLLRITLDKTKCDEKFFPYFFKAKMKVPLIIQANNSVLKHLPGLTNIRNFSIDLPTLPVQKKIASVLAALDDKIALNQRINRNLEELARLIYDYWFVQFDFPDKNSKPYKTCGGKMVYNDQLKREIPAGWEIKQICDIARFEKDSVRPSDNPKTLYKHFSIPSFDECGSYALELGESIFSDKFMISETDILVSKLNPWTSRVVWGETQENQICSTEFVVMKLNKLEEKGFLYSLVKQPSFIDYCTRGSSGTSHSHRRVNPEYMMDYIFAYNKDVVRKFSTTISQYAVMKMKNMREIRELAALRDQLLPLLMNGQISVENLP